MFTSSVCIVLINSCYSTNTLKPVVNPRYQIVIVDGIATRSAAALAMMVQAAMVDSDVSSSRIRPRAGMNGV